MKKDYKDVKGKLPLHLIAPEPLEALGKVLQYGVEKYGEENSSAYKNGDIETYRASLLRHMLEYQKNNDLDESGLPHVYHMLFNVYAMVYNYEKERGK